LFFSVETHRFFFWHQGSNGKESNGRKERQKAIIGLRPNSHGYDTHPEIKITLQAGEFTVLSVAAHCTAE